jgi:signal transduction histidine kinase
VVGGVLCLAIFVIIWNRSLHKKVKKQTESLFQELEIKKQMEVELKELNEGLEAKVERRTYLLNETNHELEKSMYELQMKQNELKTTNEQLEESIESINAIQKQLIQSEKMAALGNLVAGVAHEINTPLGVAITAVSHIEHQTSEVVKLLNDGKLRKQDFEKYLNLVEKSSNMTMKNLSYAKDLVEKFKNVAVDQQSRKMRRFKIKEYVEDIMISLYPEMKKYDINVKIDGNENLQIETYPGAISQIITNLVINSIKHGYDDSKTLNIDITIKEFDGYIEIVYGDDGVGVDDDIISKLFEPFFTTKRGFGGTGLGLNIVYNLIVDLLKGEIEAFSEGRNEGLVFKIKIPKIERD